MNKTRISEGFEDVYHFGVNGIKSKKKVRLVGILDKILCYNSEVNRKLYLGGNLK